MSHWMDLLVEITSIELLKEVLDELGIPYVEDADVRGYAGAMVFNCDVAITRDELARRFSSTYGGIGWKQSVDGIKMHIDSSDRYTAKDMLDDINRLHTCKFVEQEGAKHSYKIRKRVLPNGVTRYECEPTMFTTVTTRAEEKRFIDKAQDVMRNLHRRVTRRSRRTQ